MKKNASIGMLLLGVVVAPAACSTETADESTEAVESAELAHHGSHGPKVRGVPGKMMVEWGNVEVTPGCAFLSGPGHVGSEYQLGTTADFAFGPQGRSVVSFGPDAVFTGPSHGAPISLTRETRICPLWGYEFGFDEALVGSWGNPTRFGLSFTGKYQYRECEVQDDGTCLDDGCWIDASVVVRPRLTSDVDPPPFVAPDDECARFCQHEADVTAAVQATGCAIQGTPEAQCLASCQNRFGRSCDEEAVADLECQIAIPTTAYGCVHLPTRDVLGFPDACGNELTIYQACAFKDDPSGLCTLE